MPSPSQSTGGYLAQPLVGIWARAPYFHNGAVPDLESVLDSTQRPVAYGSAPDRARATYDPERVGWRYTVPDTVPSMATRSGRLVYDTARPGLANTGHTFGDDVDR